MGCCRSMDGLLTDCGNDGGEVELYSVNGVNEAVKKTGCWFKDITDLISYNLV